MGPKNRTEPCPDRKPLRGHIGDRNIAVQFKECLVHAGTMDVPAAPQLEAQVATGGVGDIEDPIVLAIRKIVSRRKTNDEVRGTERNSILRAIRSSFHPAAKLVIQVEGYRMTGPYHTVWTQWAAGTATIAEDAGENGRIGKEYPLVVRGH